MSRSHAPTGSDDGLRTEEVDAYLQRLNVAPDTIETPDLETLTRLLRAHVHTVPFETLAITGDPFGERTGEGVVLSVPYLYEKIVERERGGYCFELNGLFHALLNTLGYDVHRAAGRMSSALRIPANHHTNIVTLDRPYVVDVGTGPPTIRVPVPLDGTPVTDGIGTEWRVVASPRPDASHRIEYRTADESEWQSRFVFNDAPRSLHYFKAANDYLQSAPESPFTDAPSVTLTTETGYRTLSGESYEEADGTDRQERTVTGDDWHDLLAQSFGLSYRTD